MARCRAIRPASAHGDATSIWGMKRPAAITSLALVLALTGCGAGETPVVEHTPTAAATSTSPDAPFTLLPYDPTEATLPPEEWDSTFLKEVRLRFTGMASTADSDLLAAGHEACRQMDEGTPINKTNLIEGQAEDRDSPAGWNGNVIAQWGAQIYCRSHLPG